MIPAIVIGRAGSKGFPNKNTKKVLGKELLRYPVDAAVKSKLVTHTYFSTESSKLAAVAANSGASIIPRPASLSTDEALAEDVFFNAYNWVKQGAQENIGCIVLMFANAPCITSTMIDNMIRIFMCPDGMPVDSVCTVSKYNMFSVNRARIRYNGFMLNAVNSVGTTCDRNSNGNFYFYDCSCAVVSPDVIECIKLMPPPQPWLGRSIMPYYQNIPALDLDYEWQLGQIKYWLKYSK